MKFLEAVAERFARRESLDKVCFVFPNRRSGTFFKRYLGIRAERPVFVPNVLTIDELFSRIVRSADVGKVGGEAQLLYILYQEYIRLMPCPDGAEPESFDQFIFWGDMLLNDFDDIDKYLVDAKRLFVNLKDYKAISTDYDFLTLPQREAMDALSIKAFSDSFFSGLPESEKDEDHLPEGSSRRKFARLWNILFDLYTSFQTRLNEERLAYPGMIYRSAVRTIGQSESVLPEFDLFVFIGLNALNACERQLLDHLRDEGRADFYWDYFGPAVTDEHNPACRFIRENHARYPSKMPIDCPALNLENQTIEVFRIPSAVGQTRRALKILQDLHPEGSKTTLEETAVVLPDENLLFPMLGAIPESIPDVNVTMGYSLAASSGATLFRILERLQQNRRQQGGACQFYHRDVMAVLEHPLIAAAADISAVQQVRKDILKENRIFVPMSDLACGGVFDLVFRPTETTGDIPDYLKRIILSIQDKQSPVEREFLSRFHQAIADLEQAGLDLDALLPRTWFKLLDQYTALVKIPFEGEPLKGLQIMGPLETRALDFQNVILLSMNEGVFPSRNTSGSFIPYVLRKGFGLPTYEQQDAIWAYYFYRSICRAERVYLLYDSRTEGLQSGEESRFIKQLKYLYGVKLKEWVATYELSGMARDTIQPVTKDTATMNKLEDRFFRQGKAFSASSLNLYLKCPLAFYYQYVEGIRMQDDVTEEMDDNLFGTIYHAVMQKLYEPYTGELLSPELLRALKCDQKRIDRLTDETFRENAIRDVSGEDLIRRDLIKLFVKQTLEMDARIASSEGSVQLLGVEQWAEWTLPLSDGRSVHLHGKIDRLDRLQAGTVRIIDYKTGTVKDEKLKDPAQLFIPMNPKHPGVSFQLYFYLLLKTRSAVGSEPCFSPCVYWVRSLFSDKYPESFSIPDEKLSDFEQRLAALVNEVFDPKTPFAATPDSSICTFCDFKKLCNRR